ncbi:DUF2530 domain-containing protein [Tomitella biformata]|uniref:DUF2530 domain-containing protein n=1 Tax=Tomitella biformata TaxID=630403 RepID=UPI000463A137|nr:DUF2530 domain-containing protein [Tomitella biformata]
MTDRSSAADKPPVWALPTSLTDPRPVVIACVIGWIVAIIVTLIVAGTSSPILPTCYAGLGIGAIGVAIFLIQRAAARRGTRGAQRGLV